MSLDIDNKRGIEEIVHGSTNHCSCNIDVAWSMLREVSQQNGIEKLNKLELRLYAKMLTRQKRINDYSYDESLVCDVWEDSLV